MMAQGEPLKHKALHPAEIESPLNQKIGDSASRLSAAEQIEAVHCFDILTAIYVCWIDGYILLKLNCKDSIAS